MKKLFIIGLGVGHEDFRTKKAADIIRSADKVLSLSRFFKNDPSVEYVDLTGLMQQLNCPRSAATTTAVLVGGDCCFFSITRKLVQEFSNLYEIELINGISSIQYFSAKISVPYDDALLISVHGREERIVSLTAYHRKIFVLTGGKYKAHDLCRILYENGLTDVKIQIGEKLSGSDEKIVTGTPVTLKERTFDDLSVMYIENESARIPSVPIRDDDFIRGHVPMTKEEIRCQSIRKLAIQPKDILYDIGAGTGSMSVEMARCAFEGTVYAIEKNDAALELIEQNRIKHGAFNIIVIKTSAPEYFAELPVPDKAFIGGSSGNIDAIIKALVEMNPKIKIVANVISLQSLNQILNAYSSLGLMETETICVNIAKSKKIGNYDMMTAQNPVYIVTGTRRESCES
ncbi:MAG: precorrin-6y C5,15-methyltransferase (decarboxylating) subunit CbiE [Planctomycetaceae bacterium]|jgi:precorrin-6Y C5,15-methyltransferase (decarboxylating)|nr:precorrin-6y C5,15-methyltransferase (decarboxylating) subunit CbiE [Planctomycetaceae bacterium]